MAKRPSLTAARAEAAECRRCDLWKVGTQTVFGRGAPRATWMLVGEQPGDQNDRQGAPFVGPAGRVLRDALVDAGIAIEDVYLTNAVKHFKWRAQGRRRIHEKPNREEILACRVWLETEIASVRPTIIVALGATAAGTLLGPKVRVQRERGTLQPSTLAPLVSVTVHPSSILRAPKTEDRHAARRQFVEDLQALSEQLRQWRQAKSSSGT